MSLKANCYKSLVKPILEYISVVWAPHTQKEMSIIESVQKRAARFVCNDYSYNYELPKSVNWICVEDPFSQIRSHI